MSLIGVDLGTTGCKATIFHETGQVGASAYREYPLIRARPGWAELDPNLVWLSVKEALKEAAKSYRGEEIEALSISSMGEAVVPVDRRGKALGHSILYIDKRGEEEALLIEEEFGEEYVLERTGAKIHPMYSLPKLMWLREKRPKLWRETWKFLLYGDFILFRLGGEPLIDYSLASRTMAFHIYQRKWCEELLSFGGLSREHFSKPAPAGSIAGTLKKDLANELGLPPLLLVVGGHDQPCGALGAGIVEESMAVDGMGTVECITTSFQRPLSLESMKKFNLVTVPHVKEGYYVTYAFTFGGGSLLRWFRDTLGEEEIRRAKREGRDVYEILLEKASREPTSLFVLPYFSGAGTPYMDSRARGAILGLTLDTTKGELIRGILEGITYEMMVNIEALEEAGIYLPALRVMGGGAKSSFYLQLKASMMGRRLETLSVAEAGTLGAAMLAGTASGLFKSLDEAAEKMVVVEGEYEVEEDVYRSYQEKYEIYKGIYPALKEMKMNRGRLYGK